MPRTLFWLQCTHGTWVHTSDLHLVTIDMYAFVPPWHQGMYPSTYEAMSSVCCQEVTACFMSALFQHKLLASHTILQGSKLMGITGHEIRTAGIMPTWSKISTPSNWHLQSIFSLLGYKPWRHSGTKDFTSMLSIRASYFNS